MATDDANDVAKALAAFGAPSIRYHSFGQSQVRPPSIVPPPHRDIVAAAAAPVFGPALAPLAVPPLAMPITDPLAVRPPDQQRARMAPRDALREAGPLLPQEEPDAAPEPVPGLVPLELRAVDAGPAWASPVKTDGLAAVQPDSASAKVPAPPRPLAEWAPPMAAATPPNAVTPMMTPPRAPPAGAAMPPAPPPGLVPTATAALAPAVVAAPAPTIITAPVPVIMAAPVPTAPPAPNFAKPAPGSILSAASPAAAAAGTPPSSVAAMAGNASIRSLTEIFALLASGQSNAAATSQASAEMFRRG